MIKYFDFTNTPSDLASAWCAKASEVIGAGTFIGGEYLFEFEKAWAEYLDGPYVIGVANGLDALALSLKALGIEPGDLVAVPAHTFIATWLAVSSIGAIPVAFDVDESGQLDLDLFESYEGELKAVIAVHMHGLHVDMVRLQKFAQERGIKVIEDCAQAHGGSCGGKKLGTWGDAAAFSFYPTKNLGALGDGGAVVVHTESLAMNIKSLGNYGSDHSSKYVHSIQGTNSRLDSMQAAMLSISLQFLDAWNQRRIEIAHRYLLAILDNPKIGVPLTRDSRASVWHHFVILTPYRDKLVKHLQEFDIGTDMHYPHTAISEFRKLGLQYMDAFATTYPVAESFASNGLSIPLYQWMSDSDIQSVVNALRKY